MKCKLENTTDTRPLFSVPIDSLGYGKGKGKKGKTHPSVFHLHRK